MYIYIYIRISLFQVSVFELLVKKKRLNHISILILLSFSYTIIFRIKMKSKGKKKEKDEIISSSTQYAFFQKLYFIYALWFQATLFKGTRENVKTTQNLSQISFSFLNRFAAYFISQKNSLIAEIYIMENSK